ncbi:hypothetical protein SEUCBS140593_009278 [Sporothrix eucalyptigena]|uniref:Regulatory factor Sgt1 n=1 Tax=Sporothrix eucalyptigena TaxID=1812306 RepID=A0ABP0CV34_9PEZI
MEGAEDDSANSTLPPVFGSALQEDTAEYMLFAIGDGPGATTTPASKPRAMLDQLRKSALELSESLTKDYIWQRDAFDLQLVSRKDEWLIVYMLRQLTKSFPSAWARICDNDGEFLLIEGTKAVPSWITPEIDTNRVWIHDGQLKIVPLEAMQAAAETSNSRVVREVGLLLKDLAEDGDDPEALPSNLEISAWPGVDRESDDSWLNINFEDFERELDGGSNQTQSGPQATRYTASGSNNPERESGFGDSNVQADLRRIVSQFQAFLNDNDAGIDGADFGEMDRDNDSVGEDEEDEDGASEISEGPEDEVSFDEEEFAPELKGYGALRLNPPKSGKESKPTAARNITAGDDGRSDSADSGSESDDEGELDVDFNLAKNLLESFKGQEGMSGPAGNILGMLGLILPRDEDDDEKIDE